jgi:rhodanese-related sulfurtransferase
MSVNQFIHRSANIALVFVGLLATVNTLAQKQESTAQVQPISAEELKEKVSKREALTILDVRSTESYSSSEAKIKGAIHMKLRRLQTRLSFPPFKDLSHDSYVVTYCSCPNDEASIRAAQILMEAGFKRVRVLRGGWSEWLKASGPVEARPRGL